MTVIYLIRHGQAEGGWNVHPDPGLDVTGQQQARAAAEALSDRGPLPIIVSPLRRARETARPLEEIWGRPARVDARIAEIPSGGMSLPERGEWLKTLPQLRWRDLPDALLAWRRAAIECLLSISEDTVVVSHSLVINGVVSWIREEDRVVCCQPLPGSCTTLERSGGSFRLIEAAPQGASRIV